MPTLYHYCSTEAFVSIVSSRSIRLSSLALSNDSKEGSLIRDVLIRVARQEKWKEWNIAGLARCLEFTESAFEGCGFCLSQKPDLLSQWRGYADDGRGLSIGFDSEYLRELAAHRLAQSKPSFQLKGLIYDHNAMEAAASEALATLVPFVEEGAFRSREGTLLTPTSVDDKRRIDGARVSAYIASLGIMTRMFEFKNQAFEEECESRLVALNLKKDNEAELRYRAAGSKVVPYLEIPLEPLSTAAITTVFMGPKHESPPHVLEDLLKSNGFADVTIERSKATYR